MVKKCDFLQVVETPNPKNQILVLLRSFSERKKIFAGCFLFLNIKRIFKEKMSSLVGLKKSFLISRKSIDFGDF